AEHQQQHDTLGARARGLIVASHARRERQARAVLGEARRAAAAAEAGLTAFREAEDAGRKAVAAAEERYWQAEEASRQAARGREATREALIRAESRAESASLRVTELRAALAAEEAELVAAQRTLAGSDDDAVARVAPALAESAQAEEDWRAAVARLAAADDELLSSEQALAELRSQTSDRIAEAARASEEEARRAARRDQAEDERQRVSAEHGTTRAALDAASSDRGRTEEAADEATQQLAAAASERDAAQAEADDARQSAVEVVERLRALRAELDAIEEPKDGGARLGRRLVAAGWASMLESIEAPEEAWPAIEAVVGGELEGALLWSDGGDPTAEIDSARGAAHLLDTGPHDDAGRGDALAAVDGERTVAEWIGAANVPVAFRYAVVARDLDALLAGWRRLPAGWSAVTREGDLADARGIVVLHGRGDPPGGAAARAHARRRELRSTVERLEVEATSSQDAAHRATERLRRARDAHIAAGERHDAAERTARRAREELDAAEGSVSRLEARMRQLDEEIAALEDGGTHAATPHGGPGDHDLQKLQDRAQEARRRRDELAGERDTARERWTVTRTDAEALESATATRRRDRALHEARVAQLTASLPGQRASLEAFDAENATLAAAADDARTADRAAQAEGERAEAEREARRSDLRALERDHVGTASRLAELERATQETAIEASRRDEALAALARERELALEGIPESPEAAPEAEIDALDDEALEAELRRVRRTLAQIGSVNPFAVEEHREVASRLDEMTAQNDDLRAAIASTEELMAHLDREIGEQFDAAFRAIADR
ncbi:MAG TPA: hypothetical protein VIZ22_12675, partial [Candidatus Limnocylindrales bacterium]